MLVMLKGLHLRSNWMYKHIIKRALIGMPWLQWTWGPSWIHSLEGHHWSKDCYKGHCRWSHLNIHTHKITPGLRTPLYKGQTLFLKLWCLVPLCALQASFKTVCLLTQGIRQELHVELAIAWDRYAITSLGLACRPFTLSMQWKSIMPLYPT